jgi:hypothetical protein
MAGIAMRRYGDGNGALWDPEKLVFVESQKLKISQMMAIKKVRFLQNADRGTISIFDLVDPGALGGKGGSNPNWEASSEEEDTSDEPE